MIKKIVKYSLGDRNYRRLKAIWIKAKIKKNTVLYDRLKATFYYRNYYEGKRCFIVGNGPSLANVDLSKLREEFVFTVNKIGMLDGYEKMNSNFHVLADLAFFQLRDDHKLDIEFLLEQYRKIAETNPVCFLPVDAFEFVEKNNLSSILDIKYFFSNGSLQDIKSNNIDLENGIFPSANVIHYAIQIAIYMGFKEIYLLGCDSTNIIAFLNSVLGKNDMKIHVYEKDQTSDDYRKMLEFWGTADILYDAYWVFKGYDWLADYCSRENIKLINCSESTLITAIERMPIDKIM